MNRFPIFLCTCALLLGGGNRTLLAQAGPTSDSERLDLLERAVQLLQDRNAELEKEVRSLKVAKKPVFAVAAASELKLTLGGFVQMQIEAGDVSAFEGRFQSGGGEIKGRFRIRRARINGSGDYAEQFDFKLEGDFSQNDTTLTVRDATGRTLASNSSRTSFGATDVFVNWHRLPELNVKVGQYKAPFGLEQLTSDTKLFLTERSLVTTALTPERQIGVILWGKPLATLWPEQIDLLAYSLGIFNGTGRNITTNDNNAFMYVGRLEIMAMQSKILNQEAGVKFGANGFTSRDDSGNSVSGPLRVNGHGSLSSFNLPTAGQRDADGFDPGQFANDDIHSIIGGVNHYSKGDDIKLLANYIHTWSDFREARPTFAKSEFDEVIVRPQLMF